MSKIDKHWHDWTVAFDFEVKRRHKNKIEVPNLLV